MQMQRERESGAPTIVVCSHGCSCPRLPRLEPLKLLPPRRRRENCNENGRSNFPFLRRRVFVIAAKRRHLTLPAPRAQDLNVKRRSPPSPTRTPTTKPRFDSVIVSPHWTDGWSDRVSLGRKRRHYSSLPRDRVHSIGRRRTTDRVPLLREMN